MRPPLNAGENGGRDGTGRRRLRRFNEAPAERGGKRPARHRPPAGRPRFNEAPAERGGKQRSRSRLYKRIARASMRPPLNAGENGATHHRRPGAGPASMRPPLNAGENSSPAGPARSPAARFNEAPAERGGKLPRGDLADPASRASMRPPLNAGENQYPRIHTKDRDAASMRPPLNAGENPIVADNAAPMEMGFNEAPAERGGKLGHLAVYCHPCRRFNEAPAERGGKHWSCSISSARSSRLQ